MSDDWQEAEGEGTTVAEVQYCLHKFFILRWHLRQDLIPVKMEIADQKLMDQGGGAQLLVKSFASANQQATVARQRCVLLCGIQERHHPSAGRSTAVDMLRCNAAEI